MTPPDEQVLPVEDWIDLHTFRPEDVPEVVRSYLEAALAAGHGEVRIVHGRGTGVQRETVRRILAAHPRVASFADAPPHRGGWGATVAVLGEGSPGSPEGAEEVPVEGGRAEPTGSPVVVWVLLGAAFLVAVAFLVVIVAGLLGN
jgi:hypothetical protein